MRVIARLLFKDREAKVLRKQGEIWEVSEERGSVLISRNVCFEAPISTDDVPPKAQNNAETNTGKRGRGGRKSRG